MSCFVSVFLKDRKNISLSWILLADIAVNVYILEGEEYASGVLTPVKC